MANDYIVSDVNDRWNLYRNVIGVPSRRLIVCGVMAVLLVLFLVVVSFCVMNRQVNSKNISHSEVDKQVNSKGTLPGMRKPDNSMDTSKNFNFEPHNSFRNVLNVSVDPCTDFYEFSCGLWAEKNNVTEVSARVNTFNLLQNALKLEKKEIFLNTKMESELPRIVNSAIHFYNVCIQQNSIDDSNIQLLLDYFDEIGGWPIINGNEWHENSFDWFKSSAFLIKNLDIHTVIGVYTYDNDKDDKNVFYLRSPMSLQDDETLLIYYATQQMLYFIAKSLNSSLNSSDDILEEIRNLSDVENRWRDMLTLPPKTSAEVLYLSINELSQKIPGVDWLRYLQLITNGTLEEINQTLTLDDIVAIEDLEFLKKVVDLTNSSTFSKREMANLFGWFVVKELWIFIPHVLENYATVNEYQPEDVRKVMSTKCYNMVSEIFCNGVDYLYVRNSSHLGIRDIKVLTKYLKSAFQDIVKYSVWLDEVTMSLVLDKLRSMKSVIGFPDYLNNKSEFNKIFEDFPVELKVNLKYYFKISQYYSRLKILAVKVTNNKTKSILPRSVSDTGAYYLVHKNTLVYPLSLHNPPFFYYNSPWYLNFGAIGSVIAHEMMHGFDDIKHLGNEAKTVWFSNSSKISFLERAKCFKNQYFIYDNSGVCLNNGTRTLRENIADSEGLRIAFEAYNEYIKDIGAEQNEHMLSGYSPTQMFYISYANVWCSKMESSLQNYVATGTHSVPKYRVNKAASNSEAFATAFKCPKGSPMNPVKRCFMW